MPWCVDATGADENLGAAGFRSGLVLGGGCCCGCFAGIGEGEVLEGREVLGVRVIFV